MRQHDARRKAMRIFSCLVVPSVVAVAVWGQSKTPLGNEDIVKLLRAGFGEAVVLEAIAINEARFEISPQDLLALKEAGASDKVLSAMLSKAQAREAGGKLDLDQLDPGVYVRTKKGYLPLEPEVLSCCTYRIAEVARGKPEVVRVSLLADAMSAHSRSVVSAPAEFLIVCLSGSAGCDYQLLRAEENAGVRGFGIEASVQAGMVIGLEGIHDDRKGRLQRLPIEREKVTDRAFRIRPAELPKGEYGFLPPPRLKEKKVAPLGRIYTFSMQ